VTRARLVIELADGRAVYWEARDPARAEFEHIPGRLPGPGTIPANMVADWLGGARFQAAGRASLLVEGGHPWQLRIEHDSGEIPPDVAARAVGEIDAMPGHRLIQLRPYLLRIAGLQT
jgi:hypothetical protein